MVQVSFFFFMASDLRKRSPPSLLAMLISSIFFFYKTHASHSTLYYPVHPRRVDRGAACPHGAVSSPEGDRESLEEAWRGLMGRGTQPGSLGECSDFDVIDGIRMPPAQGLHCQRDEVDRFLLAGVGVLPHLAVGRHGQGMALCLCCSPHQAFLER